jgi:type II secretory pathway pseudopilin PulG
MLATLVGLSMLLALGGGIATLVGCLLAPRLRARQDRRHPQQAAARQHTQQAQQLAAEWPLLAQTLGLGATGTSGPANTASRPPSFWSMTRVSPPAWPPSPAPAWPTTSTPLPIWPTPGAVSLSGPSSRGRA